MVNFNFLENQWLIAFALNFILILIGQKTSLLTAEGWFHAGILGTILWGCLGWSGWLAVVIYLFLGSLVTKIGFSYKENLGIAEARGGRRGPENVWGSAATGAFIAILIGFDIGSSQLLLIGFSASFSAKLADTFGSEIGKRWGRRTFLITSFSLVPAGTEGAISLEGTLASAIGSFVMTIVMATLSLISGSFAFLIVIISGFLATLVESYIGAIFQSRIKWLSNELVNSFQTSLAALLAILLSILFI
tara:strand:+ start:101 stop:844 length:744 start_codon:yes stop_codon:yes gene_type:complete